MRSFHTTCSEDENGNLVIDFPDELLDTMGWSEGTELEIDTTGGCITFREVVE